MTGAVGMMGRSAVPGIIQTINSGSNAISCDWQLVNDGGTITGDGVGGVLSGSWVLPSTTFVASFYEAKVDVTGGSFTTGTTGSYLDLATTRSWTKVGSGVVTFTVTIREKLTALVRSTQAGKTVTVP